MFSKKIRFLIYFVIIIGLIGTGIDLKNPTAFFTNLKKTIIHWKQKDLILTYNSAISYYNGQGVTKDLAKAKTLLEQAADKGYAPAQCKLAYMYEHGEAGPVNLNKTVDLYTKAASQNDALAQYELSRFYWYGKGVSKDPARSKELLTQAATQKYPPALTSLGIQYENGDADTPQDISKAIALYEEAVAQGDGYGAYVLAKLYMSGTKVKQDLNKVEQILEPAAKNGHMLAQYDLGILYSVYKINIEKAMYWLEQAATQGHFNANFELGSLYYNLPDNTKYLAKAAYWFEQAAKKDDGRAQFRLALMYFKGNGIGKDLAKAMQLLEQAARNYCLQAQNVLQGYNSASDQKIIVTDDPKHPPHMIIALVKDLNNSTEVIAEAATHGYASAQFALGLLYYNGNNHEVPKDFAKAKELFEQAANQGYPIATYYLGLMYYGGNGVTKDLVKANELFDQVKKQGFIIPTSKN